MKKIETRSFQIIDDFLYINDDFFSFFEYFWDQFCLSIFSLHFTTFKLLSTLHKGFVAIKKQNNVIEIKKNEKERRWIYFIVIFCACNASSFC